MDFIYFQVPEDRKAIKQSDQGGNVYELQSSGE